MILVPYDGSEDAQAALDRLAQLMPGGVVTVLTVWEPFMDVVLRTGSPMGVGIGGGYSDPTAIDASSAKAALATAEEGADRGRKAGLVAVAQSASREGSIDATILAAAHELDADLVVMGSRGRSAVKAILLGSVSHAMLQHSDVAVMVVPSPNVAAHRRQVAREDAVAA